MARSLRRRASLRADRQQRDLWRNAQAHGIAVKPDTASDVHGHIRAVKESLIGNADEPDDSERQVPTELHAHVPPMRVAGQHEIRTP